MSFWEAHGLIFLVGLAVLPRITMFFGGTVWQFALLPPPWNVLAWAGFFLTPSLVVAMLATLRYWETNPVLCVVAWLIFLGKFGGAASQRAKRRQERE
jgi:hypothetical protein